jgi:hypothetical protein
VVTAVESYFVRSDHGEADPRVAEALDAYNRGHLIEREMLTVLRDSRVLVPIVAVAADGESEKQTDMAVPKLVGQDGREAMMAYTSTDTMKRWDPAARPVPMPMRRACEAALAENCALVVDVGGPVQIDVEGARLRALAGGEPIPPAHEDPDVRAAVEAVTRVVALSPAEGRDVVIEIRADSEQDASRAARQIESALRPRLRMMEIRAWC